MKRRKTDQEKHLVPIDPPTQQLIPNDRRQTLSGWFALYLGIEVEPGSATLEAKQRDLQSFLNFFSHATGGDAPDQWTPSITKSFQKHLTKQGKKGTSTNRTMATLRHAANWVHRHRPFLAGLPCRGVTDLHIDEPSWKGLSDLEVTRLRSAAEQMLKLKGRKNQQPIRDHAILLTLLQTGLRVSELLSLDLAQYTGKHFLNVQRKGKKITARVFLPTDARAALDSYLDEVRKRDEGPLLLAKGGNRLLRQNVDDLLKAIANQANAQLPDDQKIKLSAHILRHTMLRRAAEKNGVQFAMELAGHTSPNYIWRYVKPTDEQKEKAVEDLF